MNIPSLAGLLDALSSQDNDVSTLVDLADVGLDVGVIDNVAADNSGLVDVGADAQIQVVIDELTP